MKINELTSNNIVQNLFYFAADTCSIASQHSLINNPPLNLSFQVRCRQFIVLCVEGQKGDFMSADIG